MKMIETMKIFSQGGKSEQSIIPTDLDSIRSTLFGKFYEGIIANWLVKNEKYEHLQGKPRVYWKDISQKELTTDSEKRLYQALLQKLKNNKHTNSDGLFKKNDEFFLWEAKHWAKWTEGKLIEKQVKDLLMTSPWILAKKVKHNGVEKEIKGVLFSWWQKFKEYNKIEEEISKIICLTFKFYFTSEIIDDCRKKKYDWYLKLVNEQKVNIENFFKELLGEK